MTIPFKTYDCCIIGGGPAGLLTGVYLARFKRNIAIVENGKSRTHLIPQSHNYPGATHGISGKEIIKQLSKQIKNYKVPIFKDTILTLNKEKNLFKINGEKQLFYAKRIVLATGMSNYEPRVKSIKQAFLDGLIRHCMICDAYEVMNKHVAIIGWGQNAIKETLFMLTYTKKIALFTLGRSLQLKPEHKKLFKKYKIKIFTDIIQEINIKKKQINIYSSNNKKKYVYTVLYSALGSIGNSDLARKIGVKINKNKYIVTNNKQQTSIHGIFAVGDVACGLKQIVNAFGQAAIAATQIHNSLK